MLIGAQRQTTGYFKGQLITPTGKESYVQVTGEAGFCFCCC